TTIKASMNSKDANDKTYTFDVELPIDVRDRATPVCGAGDVSDGTLSGGSPILRGKGALANSYLSSPATAFARTDEFALPAFPATIACGTADLTVGVAGVPVRKLGPAVTFTAKAPLTMATSLRREVEVAIPVNPA